jgi:hypothetical protein
VLFAAVAVAGYFIVDQKSRRAQYKEELANLEKRESALQGDVKNCDAIDDWRNGGADWLDELLYELTVLVPDHEKMQITQLKGDPPRVVALDRTKDKGKSKEEKFVGTVTVTGKTKDGKLVDTFRDKLKKDATYNVKVAQFDEAKGEFTVQFELRKRDLKAYTRKVPAPKASKLEGGAD